MGTFAAVPPASAAPSNDFDAVVERLRRALEPLFNGNPRPVKSLFSRRDDVTLANPFGPPRRGWNEVEDAVERAAANYRDGLVRFDELSRYSTRDLGYVVQSERVEAKVGGREQRSVVSLRVTMIFRREGLEWKDGPSPRRSNHLGSTGGLGDPGLASATSGAAHGPPFL